MQYDVVHPVWKKWELSEINLKKKGNRVLSPYFQCVHVSLQRNRFLSNSYFVIGKICLSLKGANISFKITVFTQSKTTPAPEQIRKLDDF